MKGLHNIPALILFACVTIGGSRKLGCNSSMAGIQAVGIAPFDSLNKLVRTSTGVTTIADVFGEASIARFELKNTQTKYVETGTSGGDNRSRGVKGAMPMYLNEKVGEDVKLAEVVDQLMNGPVVLFIERKDGRVFAAGSQCGGEFTNNISDTGGQSGDFSGFQLDFTSDEPDFSKLYMLTGAALTEYAAAIMPDMV